MGRTRTRGTKFAALAAGLVTLALLVVSPGADAVTVEQPATVTRAAYFTNPLTQAVPPVLRNGFPPATACLVAGLGGLPQLCGPEVQQLGGLLGLSDGLPIPVTPDGDLAQVVPGTTPVGMLGGQQRYSTGIQLALPALPAGERFGSFQLVLHQTGLNFAIESPAARDLVLQVIAQVEDQDPQKILDAVSRALTGAVPLATNTITGIEACPAKQTWRSGVGQAASLDGSRLPDVECLIGTTAVYDAAAATYTFDLTYAAQAWTEGVDGVAFPNEGVILRPVGAPNLAYGDPDLSTNWIVSFGDNTAAEGLRPQIRYTAVAKPDTGGSTDSSTGDFDSSVGLPTFDSSGSLELGPITSPGGVALNGAIRARFAATKHHGGHGSTPGWVWLGIPLAAAAALIFGQSLDASPAATRRRPGALTRLVAERDAERAPTSPT